MEQAAVLYTILHHIMMACILTQGCGTTIHSTCIIAMFILPCVYCVDILNFSFCCQCLSLCAVIPGSTVHYLHFRIYDSGLGAWAGGLVFGVQVLGLFFCTLLVLGVSSLRRGPC